MKENKPIPFLTIHPTISNYPGALRSNNIFLQLYITRSADLLFIMFIVVTYRVHFQHSNIYSYLKDLSTIQNYIYFVPKKDLKNFEQYCQERELASNCKNFASMSKQALKNFKVQLITPRATSYENYKCNH